MGSDLLPEDVLKTSNRGSGGYELISKLKGDTRWQSCRIKTT